MVQRGIDVTNRGAIDPTAQARPSAPEELVPSPRRVLQARRAISFAALSVGAALALLEAPTVASAWSAPKLTIEEVGADSTAFDVVATIVMGPKEALLWDAQYHLADARRLADRISASGRHLKAIILSHPDHDHFAGTAAIVERFPGRRFT